MQTFKWLRLGFLVALVAVVGCSDDDDQATGPSVAGEYAASVPLDGDDEAEVEIIVEDDGDAEGTVLLPETAADAAALSGIAIISVAVQGFADPGTGDFDLSGTYIVNGEEFTVRLTGSLPGPGRDGFVDLEVNGETYSAPLTLVAPPTPVPTATSIPGASTPTPTTGGSNPTNTPVNNTGVSPDMLGEWVGEARNDTTGTRLNARLRIQASGSDVVVTDLNGNIFQGGNQLTMVVRDPNNLTYNAFGPPVVVFSLSLTSSTTLVGLHTVTSTSFPPTATALALDLTPAS